MHSFVSTYFLPSSVLSILPLGQDVGPATDLAGWRYGWIVPDCGHEIVDRNISFTSVFSKYSTPSTRFVLISVMNDRNMGSSSAWTSTVPYILSVVLVKGS